MSLTVRSDPQARDCSSGEGLIERLMDDFRHEYPLIVAE